MAICLGGLLSYVIYARVAAEIAVVAVAKTVHRGGTITVGDLTTVTISSSAQIPTVPAADMSSLVGKRAAFDLVAGSILAPGAVTDLKMPADDRALVGLKLATGRAPVGFLAAGSTVRLVALPPPSSAPGSPDGFTGKAFAAQVVDQQAAPDGTSTLVNVDVAAELAPTVALLAAQERLALIRDADK